MTSSEGSPTGDEKTRSATFEASNDPVYEAAVVSSSAFVYPEDGIAIGPCASMDALFSSSTCILISSVTVVLSCGRCNSSSSASIGSTDGMGSRTGGSDDVVGLSSSSTSTACGPFDFRLSSSLNRFASAFFAFSSSFFALASAFSSPVFLY